MQVLQLSTGATEIVADVQDFSQLLEKYLGHEVSGWFDAFVNKSNADLESFQEKSILENDWK